MGIRLARVYDSAITGCAKTFIIYITMSVTAPNAVDVFGTDIQCHKTGTSLIHCPSLFLRGSPLLHPQSFNPLNAELNPICHLLALLGGATIVVVSRLGLRYGSCTVVPSASVIRKCPSRVLFAANFQVAWYFTADGHSLEILTLGLTF